jgi:NitT/TauT family transport system substrate-binding protein
MATSFIDANPGVVERWRTALQKSADYANAHPDEVRAKAVELVSLDPDLVAASPVPNYVVELDLDAIEKEAGWLEEYGVIQKAASVDTMVAP